MNYTLEKLEKSQVKFTIEINEAEVVRTVMIVVEHYHIRRSIAFVLWNPFPAVRSFVSLSFAIVIVVVHDVRSCKPVSSSMLYSGGLLMADIEEMPFATERYDVGIND